MQPDTHCCFQVIEEAAEKGDLTPLVLLVIKIRLELAEQEVHIFVSFVFSESEPEFL